jgi:hypothetical protein
MAARVRPLLSTASSFAAPTVDKVERLLEVLAALRDDPLLGAVFVLHGGTALNVFSDELPRLSIDVDLMYVGQLEVSAMQTERPRVDARLREVAGKLGYAVRGTNDEHSGQTYRLRYGDQFIKIDVTYLARVALLEPVEQPCPICSPLVSFPVLDRRELVAGKVKALVERTASRDLYDLARMAASNPDAMDDPLSRALVIRAISTADPFPAVQDPVEALSRFAEPSDELVESLRTVVAVDDEPDFPAMCARVAALLAPCSALTVPEREYYRLLDKESIYQPQLLLSAWPDVLERALIDPVMEWKVRNLKKRPPGTHRQG